jgi:hypothetical protein
VARASAALALVLLGAAALAVAERAEAGGCVRWATPGGNDRFPGTRTQPFATVTRLANSLRPGQTGCLHWGNTHTGNVFIWRSGRPGAPIRIRTAPGPRSVIRGTIYVRGHDVILAGLIVKGGGRGRSVITLRGDRTKLVRSVVSGPGFLNRDAACVRVAGADHALIEGNVIRDCTRATTRRLQAVGIQVVRARGVVIRDNYVSHVTGDGIALSPNADFTRVTHNVVDGNSSALLIGGGRRVTSSGNLIADNVLSFSGKWNVHTFWLGPRGAGNVVTRNCLWRGFRRNVNASGISVYGNRVTAPRFKNRPYSLTMRQGPCFAKRPRPYAYAPTNLGLPWPKLQRFLVNWTVRALRARVQVVTLRAVRATPGVRIEFRCRRGCSTVERTTANRRGNASSVQLGGRWLPRGSVVEVRARRSGWIGSFARLRVLGLPRGIAIEHSCLAPYAQYQPVSCRRFA